MTKKQKKSLLRLCVSALLFVIGLLFVPDTPAYISLIYYIVLYLFVGWDVLFSAFKNLANRQVLDEKFLMTVASAGAMVLREYHEAVAVMLFYQIGEWFQSFAVDRSRKSIQGLITLCPDEVTVVRDGAEVVTTPEDVAIGEIIAVRPGERIPVDGKIQSGAGSIDTSALTGESVPVDVAPGDEVLSGSIDLNGALYIECTRTYENSAVSKILEMIENAADQKAPVESFITRFSRVYTPAVVILAVITAFLPPLILGDSFDTWIYRALTFLVVSCPCALVVSVPLTFFSCIGSASRHGVLIKGAHAVETLGKADVMAFDKTGTLTKGEYAVTQVLPYGCSADELLKIAAHAEHFSAHPIARSIQRAYSGVIDKERITSFTEHSGLGISVLISGKKYYVGNRRFLKENSISIPTHAEAGQYSVSVADESGYLGCLVIEDTLKDNAEKALQGLKNSGIGKLVLLTGDTLEAAQRTLKGLPLDAIEAHLLPGDKVSRLQALKNDGSTVGFVGDGLNDAPVLTAADIGIAMGGFGTDAAIEAADMILMNDDLEQMKKTRLLSTKTMRIVRENITFSLVSKIAVLITGALGLTGMNMAVFADVGVLCLCVLNALRAKWNKG